MAKTQLLRVTQVNAAYFDTQIYNVLHGQVKDFLKYLPATWTYKFQSEIELILKLAILKYSVIDHDATFGQQLFLLKYKNTSNGKKLMLVVGELFEYFRNRLGESFPRSTLYSYFNYTRALFQILCFLNISLFLRSGKYPLLSERLLNLQQVYSVDQAARHYEDKYMTRELIWNGFIEVLVYLLPLINYHKITRLIRNLNPLHVKPAVASVSYRTVKLDTKCAHCGDTPILPHHMGCPHIFCYYCLRGNQEADKKFECPVCEYSSDNALCEKVFI